MFSSVLRVLGDLILFAGIMELTYAIDKTMLLVFIILNFRLLELLLQLLIFGVSYAQVLIVILSKWSLLRIDSIYIVECTERVLSSGQLQCLHEVLQQHVGHQAESFHHTFRIIWAIWLMKRIIVLKFCLLYYIYLKLWFLVVMSSLILAKAHGLQEKWISVVTSWGFHSNVDVVSGLLR